MPRKQNTPCHHPGCAEVSEGYYCLKHKRETTRREVKRRRGKIAIYNTARWRKARLWHLRRHPLCSSCGDAGGTVDHILPIEQGADPWDSTNWQTLCSRCHQRKRGVESKMAERGETYQDTKRATIIVGPPGSGKTRYAAERASYGHLVLDLDRLFVALTGLPKYDKPDAILPFALAAFDAVINQASQSLGDVPHLWVLTSLPRKRERTTLVDTLCANLVILDVEPDVCIQRIKSDPDRSARWQHFTKLVHQWWDRYEE